LGYSSSISKYSFIFISIVLLTSITSVPAIESQSPIQTQPLPSTTDNSQVVRQIAEKVTMTNPGTNATFVEQILTELVRQSAQVSNQGNVLDEIYLQVSAYPYGIVSQSLAKFASVLSTDSRILLPTVQKIIQEKATGKSISQSLVNIAVQEASGGGKNVNDEIALAAQIIAKQSPGIPVRNIESIIIQMALEISKAQGKAITGQTIFEIASQIKQNPNGVLTQAIMQLALKDTHDNGKTGQTANVIQKVAKASKEGRERSANRETQLTNNKPTNSILSLLIPPSQTPTIGSLSATLPTKQSPQPKLGPLDTLLVYGGRYIIDYALGPGAAGVIDAIAETMIVATPLISKVVAQLTASDLVLRTANNAGPSQAIQTLNDLQVNAKSNPNFLQNVGQLAALYQYYDAAATRTSDTVVDKLLAGFDPAVAIEQTPIPQPDKTFATQMSGETQPLSEDEPEVKSLPLSEVEATTLAVIEPEAESFDMGEGSTRVVEPEPQALLPEPRGPEESVFIPGFGPSPLKEKISSLPPQDTTTVDDQPTPEMEPTISSDTGDGSTDVAEPELTSEQPFIQEPSGPE
jgi:hypothetical protein